MAHPGRKTVDSYTVVYTVKVARLDLKLQSLHQSGLAVHLYEPSPDVGYHASLKQKDLKMRGLHLQHLWPVKHCCSYNWGSSVEIHMAREAVPFLHRPRLVGDFAESLASSGFLRKI